MILNASEAGEQGTCARTQCSLEPDGTATMSYCVPPGAWSTCSLALAKNLDWFDADHEGEGVLEVRFCTDQRISGALDLWYGEYPNRKRLTLLDASETMDVSCRTVYLTPAMACYAGIDLASMPESVRWQSLPETCGNRCGRTPPECRSVDFAAARLTLAAEYAQVLAQTTLRVLSITYYPSDCACVDDRDCADGALGICRRGVCVPGGDHECGDMVGRYADGWHAGTSDAVRAAFLRHYPRLGCPFGNEGGSPFVHEVRNVELQDYLQPSPASRLSGDGRSGIIVNRDADAAFLVFGDVWGLYQCLRDGGSALGGASLLGRPTDERRSVGGVVGQQFERGWVELRPAAAGASLVVHLASPRALDDDVTSHCQGLPPIAFE